MKRGQVTLFVILGIVLVVAMSLVFYYKDTLFVMQKTQEEGIALSQSEKEIQSLVENCLEETGKEALVLLGYQGLYVNPPTQAIFYMIYDVPYLYDNGINRVPSVKLMEEQLSVYVDTNLENCLFTSENVRYGTPSTNIQINNENVVFSLDMPVTISKGEALDTLNEFNAEIDIRLGEIYAITKSFVDQLMKDKDKICLSCLLDISLENDLYTEVVEIDEDAIIIFNDRKQDIETYVLQFGVNYEK